MERKLNEVISDRINEQNIKHLAEEVSTTEPVIVHNTLSDEFDQHVVHYAAERLKAEICKMIDSKLPNIIAKAREYTSQEMWTTTVTTF